LKKNIYYLIIGLAFLGIIIIRTGLGIENFKYPLLVGLVLIILSIYYFFVLKSKNKKEAKESNRVKDDLIRYGDHIKVNLDIDNLKILSNKWQEEIIVDNSRYAFINNLTGNSDKNVDTIEVIYSAFLIEVPYKGEKFEILVNTLLDSVTLKMKLTIQKETSLYIDRNNQSRYYLDLDFLEE